MNPRDEILKVLLDSKITSDLKDIEMVNRIVKAFEPIIAERNDLRSSQETATNYIERTNEMKDSIRKLLDGEKVDEWDDET